MKMPKAGEMGHSNRDPQMGEMMKKVMKKGRMKPGMKKMMK